ncbi:hypothetical protein RRG08_007166, partial [Elysia crispata]
LEDLPGDATRLSRLSSWKPFQPVKEFLASVSVFEAFTYGVLKRSEIGGIACSEQTVKSSVIKISCSASRQQKIRGRYCCSIKLKLKTDNTGFYDTRSETTTVFPRMKFTAQNPRHLCVDQTNMFQTDSRKSIKGCVGHNYALIARML